MRRPIILWQSAIEFNFHRNFSGSSSRQISLNSWPVDWNIRCLQWFIDGDGRAVAVAVRINIVGRVVNERGVADLIDGKVRLS